MLISDKTKSEFLQYQRNEITERHIYLNLAGRCGSAENKAVLERVAADEERHYHVWKGITGRDVEPDRLKIRLFGILARVLGFTFAVKLLEAGEGDASESYGASGREFETVLQMSRDEEEHEQALLALLDEQRLRYTGSIVLGLNDAIVELTGALAGFTLVLRNTRLIAVMGCITGVAAALSMGASEYLSTKSEMSDRSPVRASVYTASTYILAVLVLILPYTVFGHYYVCLGCSLTLAVLIIAAFNYYIAVSKDLRFMPRFLEMAGISLGVAALSFLMGWGLRAAVGVDV